MKILQLLISCALFVYFIEIHCVVAVRLINIQTKTKNNSQIDLISNCSEFEDDDIVISSQQLFILLNPFKPIPPAHGITYKNGRIFRLEIVNKKLIPSTIFRLKHLKRLHIECLALSLTDLSTFDTKTSHLPEQIGKLKHLQELKLCNIGLMTLPNSIDDLSSSTSLSVPDNNLTSLPTTMINLQSLFQITLKNNIALQSIQPLNGLSFLHIIDARHCQIKHLPLDLPHLTNLYMSYNNLTYLNGIQTLGNKTKNEKYFNFDHNHILSISPNIQHVNNLRNY